MHIESPWCQVYGPQCIWLVSSLEPSPVYGTGMAQLVHHCSYGAWLTVVCVVVFTQRMVLVSPKMFVVVFTQCMVLVSPKMYVWWCSPNVWC
jgi:hypothetical protein